MMFFLRKSAFLECREKRLEFRLGSAFFGISDPGLVKKTFFKVFFHKKLTGGPGDEILEIVCPAGNCCPIVKKC